MNTKQKAEAALAALPALETIKRLSDLSETVRSLTPSQDDDLHRAIQTYNRAADGISTTKIRLPKLDADHVTTDQIQSAFHQMDGFSSYLAGQGAAETMRSSIGYAHGSDLGTGDGPKRDEIREMLSSGERQHDFEALNSEQIRSLSQLDINDESVRAVSVFANGTSLYVSDFAGRVAAYQRTMSPWLGLSTVVTSENGRPLIVPTLTVDVTNYAPGEGTAITASDPTLGTATVNPVGYKCYTLISQEAMEDESVNLSDVIARSHARSIGLAFGNAFTTTVLAGINNGGTAVGTGGNGTATATFIGYEDLIDLQYSRQAPYRLNGKWIMANSAIKKTRKYKDQQGQYLWPSEDAVSGQPSAFLGGSVWEDPYLAAVASATKSVVYGDPAAGLIIKATPIRVAVSTDFRFDTDQIAIKSVQRISGAVQDATALAFLVSANS